MQVFPAIMPEKVKHQIPAPGHLEVAEEEAGQRIDNYLVSRLKGVPKVHIYKILRSGEVRVNRGRVRPSYRLQCGDVVRLPPVRTELAVETTPPRGLVSTLENSILYEDEVLLVLNKPPGIAVHGGSGVRAGVIEILRMLRSEAPYLELVHRLDRGTSGCLLIAKRRSALRILHAMLRERQVNKCYTCLAKGVWRGGDRKVDLPLSKNLLQSGERIVKVQHQGKEAVTRFHCRKTWSGASLLDVTTLTGRTHQIRVHAASMGYPLGGDDKYGDPSFNRYLKTLGLRRLFLHAQSVSFHHPRTNKPVKIIAPLSPDLKSVIVKLDHDSDC